MIARLAARVGTARGWRRWLLALACGAFGALILAPVGFGPALLAPMVAAVWLTDGRVRARGRWRGTFADGFLLGFGYHLAGFWWLGAAFLIDPDFTWAIPFGVLGVPALLALFTGGGLVAARLLWVSGPGRALALAIGLTLAEWLRGNYLFTGFPWNPFGMALGGNLVTAQAAALVGSDGLTFLAVLLAGAPATWVDAGRADAGRADAGWADAGRADARRDDGRRGDGVLAGRRPGPTLAALALLLALAGYGAARLAEPSPGDWPGIVIRIMQPGLRPDVNFSYENREEIVSHYLALSARDDEAKHLHLADVTMLVWPESAFPFILTRDPVALERIGAALPAGTTLVTGAARVVDLPTTNGSPARSVYFNAIEVIAAGGRVIGTYDKNHLVPFGEYLPLEGLLRAIGLRNFVSIPGGFERGTARESMAVPGLPPASPLICYEAIFSGAVGLTGSVDKRTAYLFNITNDGWFGLTSGPSQHFAQARLRTIEEGLPMVRGAATGISAVLDGRGRSRGMLPLGAEGILDAGLPRPLAPPPFARFGDVPLLLVGLVGAVGLAVARLTGKRTREVNLEDINPLESAL